MRRRSLPRDRGSLENQPCTKMGTTYWTKAEPLKAVSGPTFGEPPVPLSNIIYWALVIEPFTVELPLRVTESFSVRMLPFRVEPLSMMTLPFVAIKVTLAAVNPPDSNTLVLELRVKVPETLTTNDMAEVPDKVRL